MKRPAHLIDLYCPALAPAWTKPHDWMLYGTSSIGPLQVRCANCWVAGKILSDPSVPVAR